MFFVNKRSLCFRILFPPKIKNKGVFKHPLRCLLDVIVYQAHNTHNGTNNQHNTYDVEN